MATTTLLPAWTAVFAVGDVILTFCATQDATRARRANAAFMTSGYCKETEERYRVRVGRNVLLHAA